MRGKITILLTTCLFVVPALALAQAAGGQTSGAASGSTQARASKASGQAEAGAEASAAAEARARLDAEARSRLDAEANAKLREEIKAKAEKVPHKARTEAEAKLEIRSEQVANAASAQGESEIAGRLAAEFGTTAEALMAERQEHKVGWGEVMIAHTLATNSKAEIAVADLYELHQEGMGWGSIAAGMGFQLGDVVSAVKAESQVALGASKADGMVAVVRGEGSKVGLSTSAATRGGIRAGGAGVGAGAGVNAGLGVGAKLPKVKVGR